MSKDKNNKKKGINPLSAIWESMNKTGGCCGPGETCGGSSKKTNKQNAKPDKKEKN